MRLLKIYVQVVLCAFVIVLLVQLQVNGVNLILLTRRFAPIAGFVSRNVNLMQ